MLWYIGRRLLQLIPVFFGATLLIYLMVFALPGDPIAALFDGKAPSPAVIQEIREQYNLDKPVLVQYLIWIGGVFTGDLGTTYTGRAVSDVMAEAFPLTATLAVLSPSSSRRSSALPSASSLACARAVSPTASRWSFRCC